MKLSEAKDWLARRPLAEVNQGAWVRGIQAEALRFAAEHFSSYPLPAMPWEVSDVIVAAVLNLKKIANELEPPVEKIE